jgi:hypothetical protein
MITMLIGTCDSYCFLWENFALLCNANWSVESKKIFVSETKRAEIDGYDTHLPGKICWTNRIISALEEVKTDYVFFVLEDYFLTEHITQEEIDLYIEFMEEKKANKIMIEPLSYLMKYNMKNHNKFKGRFVYKVEDYSDFISSIQPSLWRKDYLLQLLKPEWSPWDFECTGTDLIKGKDNRVYNISGPRGMRTEKIYWNAIINPKIAETLYPEHLEKEKQKREGQPISGNIISPGWPDIKKRFNLKDMGGFYK